MAAELSSERPGWPSPLLLLVPQLSHRVFCCLSSVCLLVTDSLLWESMFLSSWPSCCHLALALGETCCRKTKGRGQVKQLSRGWSLVGGTELSEENLAVRTPESTSYVPEGHHELADKEAGFRGCEETSSY